MEAVRGVIADAGGEIAGLMMPGSFDVVTNSLFLHHLPDSAAVMRLLAGMRQVAGRLMVISDLRRCRAGFAAAWLGCRVLSRSRVVHHDGPVSVPRHGRSRSCERLPSGRGWRMRRSSDVGRGG